MQVFEKDPPEFIRQRCEDAFGVDPHARPAWTYGSVVYAPHGGDMDALLMAHEAVHMEQQGDDPSGWWDRYIADPGFRLAQELQAYRVQYRLARRSGADRNLVSRMLVACASDLSGRLYGGLLTHAQAMAAIKDAI